MAVTVTNLDLEAFERLPKHARQCVFWEVEPATPASSDIGDTAQIILELDIEIGTDTTAFGPELFDPGLFDTAPFDDLFPISPDAIDGFRSEFDKEAWISGLLLEWGTCGQLAIESTTGHVVGTAFYAPPGRVPRSYHFPTAPVSADAVLLTAIRMEPGFEDSAPGLLDAVITDLIRRGVRAIEAFGIVQPGDTSRLAEDLSGRSAAASLLAHRPAAATIPPDITEWTDETIAEVAREILQTPGPNDGSWNRPTDPALSGTGDYCPECIIDAGFLKDSGFDVIASHPRFPRLRLELDEGLGWKAEVESALEKLVMKAAIDLSMRQGAAVGAGMGCVRQSRKRAITETT